MDSAEKKERKRGTIAERIEKLKQLKDGAEAAAAKAQARVIKFTEQIERLTNEAREAAGL